MHEPFGIVLLEAMAQGCAVIASKNGGPQEILQPDQEKYGYLVDPIEQKSWSLYVKELISDHEQLVEMGQKARDRSLDYRWENVLSKYLEVFED
jgi:glycosyltransferase involved in cell wall biosynthesis